MPNGLMHSHSFLWEGSWSGPFKNAPADRFGLHMLISLGGPHVAHTALILLLLLSFGQKTREGCGCFRDPFGASRKNSGKYLKYCKTRSALHSRISGAGKSKPAVNLGSTVPWTLSPPSGRDVFCSCSLLEFCLIW